MKAAAVVLAGGRSTRMGTAKAALPWHGTTLLQRTTSILSRAVEGPVLVVRAPGQPLPSLPAEVAVVDDPEQGRGPLQGLAAGLAAARDGSAVAFACATDLPFLHPAFVRRVLAAVVPGVDVALPHASGHPQPLAAGYRTALAGPVQALVATGRRSLVDALGGFTVAHLDERDLLADEALAAVDPDLDSLVNVNTPADHAAACARSAPEIAIVLGGCRRPQVARAATLGEAAAAVDVPLERHLVVTLGGHAIPPDGRIPLVRGDVVAFGQHKKR